MKLAFTTLFVYFICCLPIFGQVSLDLKFGNQGIATLSLPNESDSFVKSMVLPDNKIIALGYTLEPYHYLTVYRLKSNGSKDSTFGVNGIFAFYNNIFSKPVAVASGPNGSIYALVEKNNGSGITSYWIVKISQNGTLVFSVQVTHTIQKFVSLHKIVVLSDGKMLIFGTSKESTGGLNQLFIGRLNSSGAAWDNTFSGDGIYTYSDDYGAEGNSIQILNDGSILMGGSYTYNQNFNWFHNVLMVHLTATGALNSSIKVGGIMRFVSSWDYFCISIYLTNDGILHFVDKVKRPATTGGSIQSDFVINRYYVQTLGYVNSLYINLGTTQYPEDYLVDFDYQDGKGSSLISYTEDNIYITRIKETGELDTDFAPGGTLSILALQEQIGISSQCIQPDGKLILAGYGAVSGISKGRLARLNTRKTIYKNLTAQVCPTVGYQFYGTTLIAAGTYTHVVNMPTLDTLVTLQLSLQPQGDPSFALQSTPTLPVCQGSSVLFKPSNTLFFGNSPGYYWKKNNVEVSYQPTYTTSNLSNGDVISLEISSNYGCRFTLGPFYSNPNATVLVQPIPQPTISQSGNQLVSSLLTGTFQWLNCNQNLAAIPGATQSTYTPNQNGSYAVRVTNSGGCTGISACKPFTVTDIQESVQKTEFKIVPGFQEGEWLVSGLPIGTHEVYLYDMMGRKLPTIEIIYDAQFEGFRFETRGLPKGRYILRIGTNAQKFNLL